MRKKKEDQPKKPESSVWQSLKGSIEESWNEFKEWLNSESENDNSPRPAASGLSSPQRASSSSRSGARNFPQSAILRHLQDREQLFSIPQSFSMPRVQTIKLDDHQSLPRSDSAPSLTPTISADRTPPIISHKDKGKEEDKGKGEERRSISSSNSEKPADFFNDDTDELTPIPPLGFTLPPAVNKEERSQRRRYKSQSLTFADLPFDVIYKIFAENFSVNELSRLRLVAKLFKDVIDIVQETELEGKLYNTLELKSVMGRYKKDEVKRCLQLLVSPSAGGEINLRRVNKALALFKKAESLVMQYQLPRYRELLTAGKSVSEIYKDKQILEQSFKIGHLLYRSYSQLIFGRQILFNQEEGGSETLQEKIDTIPLLLGLFVRRWLRIFDFSVKKYKNARNAYICQNRQDYANRLRLNIEEYQGKPVISDYFIDGALEMGLFFAMHSINFFCRQPEPRKLPQQQECDINHVWRNLWLLTKDYLIILTYYLWEYPYPVSDRMQEIDPIVTQIMKNPSYLLSVETIKDSGLSARESFQEYKRDFVLRGAIDTGYPVATLFFEGEAAKGRIRVMPPMSDQAIQKVASYEQSFGIG